MVEEKVELPKLNEDGTFKMKILERYMQGGSHIIKVATPFGVDKIGLSEQSMALDLDGVPKWKKELKELLDKKYGKQTRQKVQINEDIGEFDFEKFGKK